MRMIEVDALRKRRKSSKKNKKHWATYIKHVSIQNECKYDGGVLILIDPLDNSLMWVEKLFYSDEFLQHSKIESERLASQNCRGLSFL